MQTPRRGTLFSFGITKTPSGTGVAGIDSTSKDTGTTGTIQKTSVAKCEPTDDISPPKARRKKRKVAVSSEQPPGSQPRTATSSPLPLSQQTDATNSKAARSASWSRRQQAWPRVKRSDLPEDERSTKYIDTFVHIIHQVLEHDKHLLVDDEVRVLQAFLALEHSAQCLYTRLFLRKGPWFRVDKLMERYPELGDLTPHVTALRDNGLVEQGNPDEGRPTLEVCLQLLRSPEVRQVLVRLTSGPPHERILQRPPSGQLNSKKAHVAFLLEHALSTLQVTTFTHEALGSVLALVPGPRHDVFSRVHAVYLLSDHDVDHEQEGDDDGRNGIGMLLARNYAPYTVTRERPAFETREESMLYYRAVALERRFEVAMTTPGQSDSAREAVQEAIKRIHQESGCSDVIAAFQQRQQQRPHLCKFHPGWVYWRLVYHGVELYEGKGTRSVEYHQPINMLRLLLSLPYCAPRRGKAWERLTVDLVHVGDLARALATCWEALRDPLCTRPYKLGIQHRALNLWQRNKNHVFQAEYKIVQDIFEKALYTMYNRQMQEVHFQVLEPGNISTIEGRRTQASAVGGIRSAWTGVSGQATAVNLGVEEFVLDYYSLPEYGGWKGLHSEGAVWGTLFGILMWPVIWAPIPDQFHHSYQDSPLDLDCAQGEFYLHRQSLITDRLQQIRTQGPAPLIAEVFQEHAERQTSCRGVSWDYELEDLQGIATGLSRDALCQILLTFCTQYRHVRSGMPDLVLWRELPTPQTRLVEVKGPGDSLSNKQRVWIDRFCKWGVDIWTQYVRAHRSK